MENPVYLFIYLTSSEQQVTTQIKIEQKIDKNTLKVQLSGSLQLKYKA